MAHFWVLLCQRKSRIKERCPRLKKDLAIDFCPSPTFGNFWTEGSCSCFRCCFSWILRCFLDSHQKQNKKNQMKLCHALHCCHSFPFLHGIQPEFYILSLMALSGLRKSGRWSILAGIMPIEKQPLARLQSALSWRLCGFGFFFF